MVGTDSTSSVFLPVQFTVASRKCILSIYEEVCIKIPFQLLQKLGEVNPQIQELWSIICGWFHANLDSKVWVWFH